MHELPQDWKRDSNFDLTQALNDVKGPIIEVGGPTESGFPLANWDEVKKKVYVSNIEPGAPIYGQDGTFSHYYGKVDFLANAKALPFGKNTIGAIRADALPPNVFEDAILEARRVLIVDGLLILQSLDADAVLFVSKNGFKLIQYEMKDDFPHYTVFKKTI